MWKGGGRERYKKFLLHNILTSGMNSNDINSIIPSSLSHQLNSFQLHTAGQQYWVLKFLNLIILVHLRNGSLPSHFGINEAETFYDSLQSS